MGLCNLGEFYGYKFYWMSFYKLIFVRILFFPSLYTKWLFSRTENNGFLLQWILDEYAAPAS